MVEYIYLTHTGALFRLRERCYLKEQTSVDYRIFANYATSALLDIYPCGEDYGSIMFFKIVFWADGKFN
jgi:hypothetical protein